MNKKGPLLLLLILFLVLVFVVGIRYGQKVEQANKTIHYLVSLTPSPIPKEPTPLVFKPYTSKECDVTFLYPNSLTVKESTIEAVFKEKDKTKLIVGCSKTDEFFAVFNNSKVASAEVTVQTRTIQAKSPTKETLLFRLNHPVDGRNIFVTIDKMLFPLFERTLQYTR